MSVDTYRREVDRLTGELAALERKAAEHRERAAKDRSSALSATTAAERSSSASTVRMKLSEATRRSESAADHEKKAAAIADQAASKQRLLTTARTNLERAQKAAQAKDVRESDRRRKEDVRHVTDLERRRREAMRPIADAVPQPSPSRRLSEEAEPGADGFRYDVCLSFAGEQRSYVELVAGALKSSGLRVFYDLDEKVELWGKDLPEHLDRIYRIDSRYCVMFISKEYAAKEWTRHERRSALSRAVSEPGDYVLPVRFDDTELPGLRPSIAYLDLSQFAPATLAEMIIDKVGAGSGDGAGS